MNEKNSPSVPVEELPLSDSVREAMAITLRGCDELLIESEFAQKLARSEKNGKPLRIKLGLDPTAPDLHLGHTVVLNKMRQLQDLGHVVIFLIGDFTSMIGDPSGRNITRPPLTREQVKENAMTYFSQASLVLDPEKTEIRYNSEWSDGLGAGGMIQLASQSRVAVSVDAGVRFGGFEIRSGAGRNGSEIQSACRARTSAPVRTGTAVYSDHAIAGRTGWCREDVEIQGQLCRNHRTGKCHVRQTDEYFR